MSLAWFVCMPWESAKSSLIVAKPLDPASSVANPTMYGVSLNAFQSGMDKSFFVTMLIVDTRRRPET
jgi:hypothetical protein